MTGPGPGPASPEGAAGVTPGPGAGQYNTVESGGALYSVVHGDLHIRNGHPVYRVEPFPVGGGRATTGAARRRPSGLLAAERRVVAFSGRDEELARLTAWRDAPEPGVSAYLLHGPGGQGKTRLAGRLAELSAGRWTVWAAHHLGDPTEATAVAPGASGPALLVVVEYADRWPVDDLLLLLRNPLLRHPERSRVLLVARSGGAWWLALRHRLAKAGVDVGGTLALGPLARAGEDRRRIYEAARNRFAAPDVLDVPEAARLPAPALDGEPYSLVLTVHMAALVAVDAARRGVAAPRDPVALSAYLLDREHDHWQSLYDHGTVTTPPEVLARTVYLATLSGPLPAHRAVELLEAAAVGEPDSLTRVLRDHAVCYPADPGSAGPPGRGRGGTAPDDRAEVVLRPLRPDRLGEDFVALLTPGHASDDYAADPWAARGLRGALSWEPERGPRPWTPSVFTVLFHAAARWPHLAAAHLDPVLVGRPWLAHAAGAAALSVWAADPGADPETIRAVYLGMPPHGDVRLNTGIAALARRLADDPAGTADPGMRAARFTRLAWHLAEAEQFAQAAQAADESVRVIRRILADADAAGVAPRSLPPSGREDRPRLLEELEAARAKARLYREVAAQDPTELTVRHAARLIATAEGLLARSDGNFVHVVGLEAAEQALALYRQLVEADAATHTPGLSYALMANTAFQRLRGHRRAALESALEGLSVGRGQARSDAAHAWTLRDDLVRVSEAFAALGRGDEALDVAETAVSLGRRLVAARGEEHLRGLAAAVLTLARRHAGLGLHTAALHFATEAVELARTPTAAEPEGAEADPPEPLLLVAVASLHRGGEADAERIAGRLVSLQRPDGRARRGGALAASLTVHACALAASGRPEQALPVVRQAVDLLREAVRPSNAASVTSVHMTEDGPVRTSRPPALHFPAQEPNLAAALVLLTGVLARLGQDAGAERSGREAALLLRRLSGPVAFEPDLADTWWRLALARHVFADLAADGFREAMAAAEAWYTAHRRRTGTLPGLSFAERARLRRFCEDLPLRPPRTRRLRGFARRTRA